MHAGHADTYTVTVRRDEETVSANFQLKHDNRCEMKRTFAILTVFCTVLSIAMIMLCAVAKYKVKLKLIIRRYLGEFDKGIFASLLYFKQ